MREAYISVEDLEGPLEHIIACISALLERYKGKNPRLALGFNPVAERAWAVIEYEEDTTNGV